MIKKICLCIKMKIINLLISLFSIIKTKALECITVVNQKCMPRPKICK